MQYGRNTPETIPCQDAKAGAVAGAARADLYLYVYFLRQHTIILDNLQDRSTVHDTLITTAFIEKQYRMNPASNYPRTDKSPTSARTQSFLRVCDRRLVASHWKYQYFIA